jgi:hypothetical protein
MSKPIQPIDVEETRKRIFKFIKYHYFKYHQDWIDNDYLGGWFKCYLCQEVRDTETGCYFQESEDEYGCLNCKKEFNLHDICSEEEEEEEECDDCEGKCRSNETETCENCAVKLRIGCGNNPSDESIFNGLCDDCREKEEEE